MTDWLTARPVAHRGLHDGASGVIENTPSAFSAAIAGNYGIECDLQITADGEAMVHHDEALGRLTEGAGRLDGMTAAELKRVPFRSTQDRMLTLGELHELVAGRVTLLLELKSRFDGDLRLATCVAKFLGGYGGPIAVMSFDPKPIAALKDLAPKLRRGLVAQKPSDADTSKLSRARYGRQLLAANPQFLAYRVQDLPSALPQFARNVLRRPLLTWTVRTPAERIRAANYADQMIFEGFRP